MLGLDTSTQHVETMKASSRPLVRRGLQNALDSKQSSRCLGKMWTVLSKAGSSWESTSAFLSIFLLLVPITAANPCPVLTTIIQFISIIAARSPRSLSERRISHIGMLSAFFTFPRQSLSLSGSSFKVSVCEDPIPADSPASGIRHLRIPVPDVDYADLLIHLPTACSFIHQALKDGGIVLVHCEQGLSRSATVVAAYCKHVYEMVAGSYL